MADRYCPEDVLEDAVIIFREMLKNNREILSHKFIAKIEEIVRKSENLAVNC